MKKRIYLLLLLLIGLNELVTAQGWIKDFICPAVGTVSTCVANTADGGFIGAGYKGSFINNQIFVFRTNRYGDTLWSKTYNQLGFSSYFPLDVLKANEGNGFIIGGNSITNAPNPTPANIGFMLRIDDMGNQIWLRSMGSNNKQVLNFLSLGNGYLVTRHEIASATQVHQLIGSKYDNNGILVWNQTTPQTSLEMGYTGFVQKTLDNGFVAFTSASTISKFDNNGNLVWQKPYPYNCWGALASTPDSNFIVSARKMTVGRGDSVSLLFKLNKTGDIQWTKIDRRLLTAPISATADGGIVISDDTTCSNGNCGVNIQKIDRNGLISWQKLVDFDLGLTTNRMINRYIYQIKTTPTNGYILAGLSKDQAVGTAHLILADSLANVYADTIKGKIFFDQIANCNYNIGEIPLKSWIVKATRADGISSYSLTDSMGNFTISVDTGTYTLSPFLPNSYWNSCAIPSVNISNLQPTAIRNIGMTPNVNCPALEVDIAANGLRKCYENEYTISYKNNGTVAAQNAYVVVSLDGVLRFLSADRPLVSQTGRDYRFDLGTLSVGQWGSFKMRVRVPCGDSTVLGQTLCTQAHIYPDSLCNASPLWTGGTVSVSGTCGVDSVYFYVSYRGRVGSTSSRLYPIVVEDEIIFRPPPPFNLGNGSSYAISAPADGSTWRLSVGQEPNHPGSSKPTAVVEGCGRNRQGGFSTGNVNIFSNDDGNRFVSIACLPVVASFDPNEKEAFPIGYKAPHYIDQNQDLDYVLHFQNTGTDTALNIRVEDVIPKELDLTSIEFGASSHAYTASIRAQNTLVFSFPNIYLPDSRRNEVGSHGFVKFRIKQKRDLAIGTKIFNNAQIYFDFNPPIVTNQTMHTIGQDYIITAVPNAPILENIHIKVYPNPFVESATFEIEAVQNFKTLTYMLFDQLGRTIQTSLVTTSKFHFEANQLSAGIYYYRFEGDGQTIGTGKLVIAK
jgi:uncharacterized repeat protein (TIGR01451 family)